MAQTKYKMPLHIKRATIWQCRGYYDALDWIENNQNTDADKKHYNFCLVESIDNALCNIGSDLINPQLQDKLRKAIWESTLNGREYPYEAWDLPTICRDDFYERKRKFIKEVAVNMGFIEWDE